MKAPADAGTVWLPARTEGKAQGGSSRSFREHTAPGTPRTQISNPQSCESGHLFPLRTWLVVLLQQPQENSTSSEAGAVV